MNDAASDRRKAPAGARAGALLLGLALAIAGPRAHAAPSTTVVLSYEVESEVNGCLDAAAFRAKVQRQLGYDPFVLAADRRVAVAIGRGPTGLTGRIRWSDAGGRWTGDRELSARRGDCPSLIANLAFSVGVQLQLLESLAQSERLPATTPRTTRTPPPSTVKPPPVAVATAPRPSATVAAAAPAAAEAKEAVQPSSVPLSSPEAPTSPRPLGDEHLGPTEAEPAADAGTVTAAPEKPPAPLHLALSVGLGPSLAFGLSPRATALGRVFASGRIEMVSLELAVDASWPITERAADASGFTLERAAAAAAACGHVQVFAFCLTGAVGTLRARGVGVDQPTSPTGIFYQAGARIGARLDLGDHFFVAARADGLLLLSTWTVQVNQLPVWVTPRAGGLVGVDLGASF